MTSWMNQHFGDMSLSQKDILHWRKWSVPEDKKQPRSFLPDFDRMDLQNSHFKPWLPKTVSVSKGSSTMADGMPAYSTATMHFELELSKYPKGGK
jgi:hypothetical protein